MKKIVLTFSFSIIQFFAFAQISGNQVYEEKNYSFDSKSNNQNMGFTLSDNALTINVNVLLNQNADKYKITLGVSEEAENVKSSLEKINARINNFSSKLSKIGISQENIYVDFISQNKIYDYTIDENKRIATQKTVGFEIKKNIIIEISNYDMIEKIIGEASEFQIFDIIKVDYINTDYEKIRQNLMTQAYEILQKKKEEYQKRFGLTYLGNPKGNENFYFVFPKTQYREYTAFESSNVQDNYYNNNNYIKKDERKSKTFYYEGVDYNGFDKVINNSKPEIGIQYVVSLSMNFDIKRN